MNLQLFFFKISMIVFYILRIAILVAPIAIVLVYSKQGGWKYGFTFIQNSLDVGLYVSFAIAFLLGLYHALSFELIGKSPNENYLKSNQKVRVKGTADIAEIKQYIESNLRYRDLKVEDNRLTFKNLVYFSLPDVVSIEWSADGLIHINSKPFTKLWFIDFGRNFKTVRGLAQFIKSKT